MLGEVRSDFSSGAVGCGDPPDAMREHVDSDGVPCLLVSIGLVKHIRIKKGEKNLIKITFRCPRNREILFKASYW